MSDLASMFGGAPSDRFMGLPGGDLDAPAGEVVIFGADSATPYASVGPYCAGGADAIRAGSMTDAGAFDRINFDTRARVIPDGVAVEDAGNVPFTKDSAEMRQRIRTATGAVLDAGGVPIILGGDDSVPIPFLQAFKGKAEKPGHVHILQIDAHIDWRDDFEGEAMGLSSTMRRASEMAHVQTIVQIGQRGIGSAGAAELKAAERYGAVLVPGHDVGRGGVAVALAAIPPKDDVVICLDVDALDPSIMPAVIAPTAGGLGHWDVIRLIQGVAAKARIAGFALVEFKKDADLHGIGARTAAQILASAIGIIAAQ
ncbi:MAG: arginase family protein [Pseudomonadota bacterium]